jgi:hypothetical protein
MTYNGAQFPCKVCELSRHNTIHQVKSQFGYHEFQERMSEQEKQPLITFSVGLPCDVYDWLRDYAVSAGVSMAEVARAVLVTYRAEVSGDEACDAACQRWEETYKGLETQSQPKETK